MSQGQEGTGEIGAPEHKMEYHTVKDLKVENYKIEDLKREDVKREDVKVENEDSYEENDEDLLNLDSDSDSDSGQGKRDSSVRYTVKIRPDRSLYTVKIGKRNAQSYRARIKDDSTPVTNSSASKIL